VKEES